MYLNLPLEKHLSLDEIKIHPKIGTQNLELKGSAFTFKHMGNRDITFGLAEKNGKL